MVCRPLAGSVANKCWVNGNGRCASRNGRAKLGLQLWVMKHEPFQSIYRPDFEVVEERHGRLRRYPHTEQLPALHRALNMEFLNALPDHIARTDKRGNGFQKNLLKHAGMTFCNMFNAARTDGLHLHAMPDPDLVTRLVLVQQVTEETRRGVRHRFKYYGGAAFQPDIRISGKPLVFTDHVLERFSTRVPNKVGEHLCMLLLIFFGSPIIALPVGPNLAFIMPYHDTLLAFPFELEEDELVITTCLTIHEMNSLERQMPPLAFNVHYGAAYAVPRIRHWFPAKWMFDVYAKWERKVPLPPPLPVLPPGVRWHRVAQLIKDNEVDKGHGPGTTYNFLDHVPGPYAVEFPPSQPEPRVDERQLHKQIDSKPDWDAAFDHRDHFIVNFMDRKPPPK